MAHHDSSTSLSLALLRDVSRSFYLSMRVLPAPLRAPVGTGYLLARTTDTVADTASVPVAERQAHLAALAAAIEGRGDELATGHALAASFAPQQRDEAERRLILALPSSFAALHALDAADREDVRAVLRPIAHGQSLDLIRFAAGTPQAPAALADDRELDDYTGLVAGCVGEFWTRLGLRHLPQFSSLPADRLMTLASRYGRALQLVNILRDAGDDLASGRCYLPADALAALGLQPAQVLTNPQAAAPLLAELARRARAGLADGMVYALSIGPRRVRAASALPALIGLRTLSRLEAAGADALRTRIKVPRREVQSIAWRIALGGASRATLRSLAAMGESVR